MRAADSATRASTSSTANRSRAGKENSLYFNGQGHAGGDVFDFGKPEVRDFLIQNGEVLPRRVPGRRLPLRSGERHRPRRAPPHGWGFCQDLTSTLNHHRPGAIDKAEYWNVNPYVVKPPSEGAGFDTTLTDGLRIAIRDVIGNAAQPDERPLNMTGLARNLWPDGFSQQWRFVQGPENHDIVLSSASSGWPAWAISTTPARGTAVAGRGWRPGFA